MLVMIASESSKHGFVPFAILVNMITNFSLLIECWMRMASGSAIDEQYEELERRRALLSSSTFEKTEEDTKDALAIVPTTDSDDEDPNAIFSENFVAKDSANAVNKNISGQLRPPDDYDYDSDQSFC